MTKVVLCLPDRGQDFFSRVGNYLGRFSQNAYAVLNKSLVYKYEMLVTFHAIWYVFAELCTPAWQKDLRDITFYIIQAMEEAKKE